MFIFFFFLTETWATAKLFTIKFAFIKMKFYSE